MSGRVVVIGGGVIGLSTALYLQRAGWQVTVVERGAPEHDSCSLGNAGMIVPSHFVPLAAPGMVAYGLKRLADPESPFALSPRLSPDLIRWGWRFMRSCTKAHVDRSVGVLRDLNLRSRALYEELSGSLDDDFGLTQRGLLMLCKEASTLEEESHFGARARELGIPAETVSSDRLRELDPDIDLSVAGGVFFPKDCHLSPGRFVAAATRELQRGGATFVWETEATGWSIQSGRVVEVVTTNGRFGADHFVVAGGAWSPAAARGLGLRLPMQAGKGYSMTLPAPPQLPRLCSILVEARVAVTPMGNTLRIGGTMEIAGNDLSVNERRVEGIRKSIPRYFPKFRTDDFRGVPVWSGLRPCSPDGLPYLGPVAGVSGAWVATGHAMMGLSLGPVTGEIMAGLISGTPVDFPMELLAPGRF
jgi:D-amino-acid dehydrogenase